MTRTPLEVWAPLPPDPSGISDFVEEQLPFLARDFDLKLVAPAPEAVRPDLRDRFRVLPISEADESALRLYHLGNSPAHAAILRAALRTPGIVVLHEWNLHELFLGEAVRSRDFEPYRREMRREHGAHGAVAADAMQQMLGGSHWPALFPLNAAVLESALAVVTLAASTAGKVRAALPDGLVEFVPHHAQLVAKAVDREGARVALGLASDAKVVLAPGLATAAKSLSSVRLVVERLAKRDSRILLLSAGGGTTTDAPIAPFERALGRVPLETLGDAILAADVVCALRFPSRGEASGVVMRSLAAGRAVVVSAGSTADEELREGVVARVSPGPAEAAELEGVLDFLLNDEMARTRLERLASAEAGERPPSAMAARLAAFIRRAGDGRAARLETIRRRKEAAETVRPQFRDDLEAAARSLGLVSVPARVFERLAGL